LAGDGVTLDRIYPGLDHGVAVTDEGTALTWGRNDRGQLGLGDTNDRNTPVAVTLPDTSVGLVRSACAGQFHTLLLTSTGAVLAMGGNAHGQLGTGEGSNMSSLPTRVAALAGIEVTAVACGTAHSLALASSGEVYAWGAANAGQLGLGLAPCSAASAAASPADCELQPQPQPTRVPGLPAVKLIAAGGGFAGGAFEPGALLGGAHSLFVSAANEVWAAGDNFYGSLGVRHKYTSITPYTMGVLAYDFDGATEEAALGDAVLSANASGTQLAYTTLAQYLVGARVRPGAWASAPARVTSRMPAPVLVGALPGGAEIVSIVAGAAHSMVLTAVGEIFAWGDNRYGQLGLGYTSWPFEDDLFFQRRNTEQPVLVDRPIRLTAWDYVDDATGKTVTGVSNAVGGGKIIEIHAGPRQSMALTAGGTAWIWGSNTGGGLGTCGCGQCAALTAAAGSCPAVAAPPPPPPALDDDGLPTGAPPPPPPAPPPGARDTVTRMPTGASCTCTCPGHGNTCRTRTVYDATGADTGLVNKGVCVTGDGDGPPICQCEDPYVAGGLTGTIVTHDLPMPLDMAGFTFETVAAGGALFAVSISVCPEDSIGRACANSGTCVTPADGGEPRCECYSGYAGTACEYECGSATPAELAAVIRVSRGGYKSKFLGGLYDPMKEGNMTGLVCSGHGNCTGAQGCACEEGWHGDHCQLMCYRDNERKYCSGNGRCSYDKSVDALPYCLCDHAFDAGGCAALGLFYREEFGACSYHDFSLGFEACFKQGLCGICANTAPPRASAALAAAAIALLLAALVS
jgi:alpha-tubulin suppressor-like RCC1 family protein